MGSFEIIKECLVGMFTEPDEAFKRAANNDISLILPVVILIIIGILLGAVVMKKLPGKIETLKKSGRTLTHNVEPQIKSEKAKAFVYPFFTVIYWFLFNIVFGIIITKMNGLGEMSGIFKATSLLTFPYLVAIFIKFLAAFVPAFGFVYSLFLFALAIWTAFALWKIAVTVGQLSPMDGALAAGVPAFFFMMFWLSYDMIINLFVYRFAG